MPLPRLPPVAERGASAVELLRLLRAPVLRMVLVMDGSELMRGSVRDCPGAGGPCSFPQRVSGERSGWSSAKLLPPNPMELPMVSTRESSSSLFFSSTCSCRIDCISLYFWSFKAVRSRERSGASKSSWMGRSLSRVSTSFRVVPGTSTFSLTFIRTMYGRSCGCREEWPPGITDRTTGRAMDQSIIRPSVCAELSNRATMRPASARERMSDWVCAILNSFCCCSSMRSCISMSTFGSTIAQGL
mmetsp:Transcript_5682/g.16768  ORF Transcript_5682/g.16768 Transcript_5682/m.16768 type:complete len:244 (-) Transcript_5682:442-1173(-)